MTISTGRGGAVASVALLLLTAGVVAGQAPARAPWGPGTAGEAGEPGGERLSLAEVYELARERNPMLRAATARVDATAAQEASAGVPPDPTVQVGVMNFSLPGFETDMPNSMAPSVQAMQMLPFPGKLGLSEAIAEHSTTMARASAAETWWEVRTMAARAFFGIYEIDWKLAVMRETLSLLENFQEVAEAMYGAGTGRQSDVLRASVEVARMDAEIEKMVAMRRVASARLNALLNRPAETPVPRTVLPALPAEWPEQDRLRTWAEETRPMLERSRTGVEQAQTRRQLAHRQIWPDFSIGVQYGQRDAGAMGTARMGSAIIGFSVPIFMRSRQLRLRDEAAARQSMAEAQLVGARADVDARLGELLAELDRAQALLALYRGEVLPQAGANVESSFSSYRVGAVDFMTLVDAQMTANRYDQEYYALLADYGRAVAELEMTVGRELPVTTEPMAEAR